MKKLFILAVVTLLISCEQNNPSKNSNETLGTKKITLEDIWGTTFSTNRMNALNSMNGDYYSLLNYDENGYSTVDKYSYTSLEKVATVVEGKTRWRYIRYRTY